MMLRLSQGTSIVFIDGQPLIFSPTQQALLGVNQIAGYVGCRLEEGVRFDQLAREVLERGIVKPEEMLRDVLAKWSLLGLIGTFERAPASQSCLVQSIRVGATGLTLRYHDEELVASVAALFAHLQDTDGRPDISYDLWQTDGMACLSRNGETASVMRLEQVAPILKAKIAEDVLQDPSWLLALHAGCVHRHGKVMLLLGEPGAGKTTLTSWLTAKGFDYGGDDITFMDATGRVRGLPFLPSVKSGSWPLLKSIYEDLPRLPVHMRTDKRRVRFPMPRNFADSNPVEIGWIVKLRRRSAGPAKLSSIDTTTALKHLLAEATSQSQDMDRASLDVMIDTVTSARSCELHYADLEDAALCLRQLCDQ